MSDKHREESDDDDRKEHQEHHSSVQEQIRDSLSRIEKLLEERLSKPPIAK